MKLLLVPIKASIHIITRLTLLSKGNLVIIWIDWLSLSIYIYIIATGIFKFSVHIDDNGSYIMYNLYWQQIFFRHDYSEKYFKIAYCVTLIMHTNNSTSCSQCYYNYSNSHTNTTLNQLYLMKYIYSKVYHI